MQFALLHGLVLIMVMVVVIVSPLLPRLEVSIFAKVGLLQLVSLEGVIVQFPLIDIKVSKIV